MVFDSSVIVETVAKSWVDDMGLRVCVWTCKHQF